jgi:hypothetical protein
LESAGFDHIEISETHRVHEHAAAAIIRARKPPSRLELQQATRRMIIAGRS